MTNTPSVLTGGSVQQMGQALDSFSHLMHCNLMLRVAIHHECIFMLCLPGVPYSIQTC